MYTNEYFDRWGFYPISGGSDDTVVEDVIDAAETITETVTEPVQDSVAAVEEAAVDTIGELSSALTLQAERMDAQSTTLGTIMSTINMMNETLSGVAQSAIRTASEITEEVVEVPEEVVETVEAVVETNPEPPANRRKRMMGRKRGKK